MTDVENPPFDQHDPEGAALWLEARARVNKIPRAPGDTLTREHCNLLPHFAFRFEQIAALLREAGRHHSEPGALHLREMTSEKIDKVMELVWKCCEEAWLIADERGSRGEPVGATIQLPGLAARLKAVRTALEGTSS